MAMSNYCNLGSDRGRPRHRTLPSLVREVLDQSQASKALLYLRSAVLCPQSLTPLDLLRGIRQRALTAISSPLPHRDTSIIHLINLNCSSSLGLGEVEVRPDSGDEDTTAEDEGGFGAEIARVGGRYLRDGERGYHCRGV